MKFKIHKSYLILISLLTAVATGIAVSGCGNQAASSVSSAVSQATESEATAVQTTTAQPTVFRASGRPFRMKKSWWT